MSPKQPSKQKRAAQNRNQRAARAARAANANATPASTGTSGARSGGGSLFSRLRGGGSAPRSAAAAPATSARARGAALRAEQPPGYRAAMSAVLAAAAAIVLCAVALRYPVDARGDVYSSESLAADWSLSALREVVEQPGATAEQVAEAVDDWVPGRSKDTVLVALWPFSLAIVLPLVGAGIGFHAVRRRAPSKVVNRALYATLFGAVLTQGLLLLFLPVVLGMGVAMFQVRKAETIAAATAASVGGGAEIIDAEVIEHDDVLEPDDDDAEPADTDAEPAERNLE